MGGRLKLGQILVSKGLISPEQLASALGEQERWGSRLGMTLVRLGFLEEETLVRVLAGQLRLPVARIGGKTVNGDVLRLISVEQAEKYRCLPLFVREEAGAKVLFLAMEDPSDLQALDELCFQVDEKLRPVLVAPTELEDALTRHYHGVAGRGLSSEPLPALSAAAPAPEQADTAPDLPPLDSLPEPGPREASAPLRTGPAFEAPPPPAAEHEAGMEPQLILRALSQLLVEKGVISRKEFVERLRRLAGHDA
jgi:type IV pilus assembly protein PilB